jgi:putative SOS response-associated peptidase YedK
LLRADPESSELQLAMARWGLIPFWWKQPKPPGLDPEQADAGKVLSIAREVAVTQVEFYPVSKRVNNAKNEGAELIAPFEIPA